MRFWEIEKSIINEVNMSPSGLLQFAKSPVAQALKVGFEAEVIFEDAEGEVMDEPDFDRDYEVNSLEDIREFFSAEDVNDEDTVEELINDIQQIYNEKLGYWIVDNADDEIEFRFNNQYDAHESTKKYIEDNYEYTEEEISDILSDETSKPYRRYSREAKEEAFEEFKSENLDSITNDMQDDAKNNLSLQQALKEYFDLPTYSDVVVSMKTIYDNIDSHAQWPYVTSIPDEDTGGYNSWGASQIARDMAKDLGIKIKVNTYRHENTGAQGERDWSQWHFEPDSSIEPDNAYDMGIEIISPPESLNSGIDNIRKTFNWLVDNHAYTNQSTGFHIGISLPSQTTKDIDFVKLAVFLGDIHVLKEFDRYGSAYARSAYKDIISTIQGKSETVDPIENAQTIATIMHKMKSNMMKDVAEMITYYTNHNMSINMRENYIEFRSAGGVDYIRNVDGIISTLLRYARAMTIAADPEAEKQEYIKKLYKIFDNSFTGMQSQTIDAFAKFSAGQLDKEDLIDYLKRVQSQRPKKVEKPEVKQQEVDNLHEDWEQFKDSSKLIEEYTHFDMHHEFYEEVSQIDVTLFENGEDYTKLKNDLSQFSTPSPVIGEKYAYVSIASTPAAKIINVADLGGEYKLLDIQNGKYVFDVDGVKKTLPEQGSFDKGDSYQHIFMFPTMEQYDEFNVWLTLKYGAEDWKLSRKTISKPFQSNFGAK